MVVGTAAGIAHSIGRLSSTWIGANDNDGQYPGGESSGMSDMVRLFETKDDGGAEGVGTGAGIAHSWRDPAQVGP